MSGDSVSLSLPIYIVDAFTGRPFQGNPAAVCLLSPTLVLTDEQMQQTAAEMNLSETAFVSLDEGDFVTASLFGLRWFTPATEVDLCGHATLASSAVLFNEIGNSNEEITFITQSGPLKVKRFNNTRLSLNFPENAPSPVNPADFKRLLEITMGDVSLVQDVQLSKSGKLLIRLKDDVSREIFENFKPQTDRMIESDLTSSLNGVGITLKGSRENNCVDRQGNVYDFVSRYFSPWHGIPEDPVTGAWHTVAGPYWSKELNKLNLYARQCSKRGGDLWVTVADERVNLIGEAVVNLRGKFSL